MDDDTLKQAIRLAGGIEQQLHFLHQHLSNRDYAWAKLVALQIRNYASAIASLTTEATVKERK